MMGRGVERGGCGGFLEKILSPRTAWFDRTSRLGTSTSVTQSSSVCQSISGESRGDDVGGFGSGRWPMGLAEVVEDARVFHVRDLPSPRASRVHRWSDGGAVLLHRHHDIIVVRFAMAPERLEVRVALAPAPLTFGTRWWFRCPRCTVHVGAIYFSGAALACRRCLRLRYRSQYASMVERAASEHVKASAKVGATSGVFDGVPPRRPTRMWRRTFAAHLDEIAESRRRWRVVVRE